MRTLLTRAAVLVALSILAAQVLAEGDSKAVKRYAPSSKANPTRPTPPPPGAMWLRERVPFAAPALKSAPLPPTGCHAATDTVAWVAWRERAIVYLLQAPEPSVEEQSVVGQDVPYLRRLDVARRATVLVKKFDACTKAGKAPPENLLGNLMRFVRTQHLANTDLTNPVASKHQFGHGPEMVDAQYLRVAGPALELPCLLRSQEFLRALSSPKTYSLAFNLIKRRNQGDFIATCRESKPPQHVWDTLIYRSRFLTTPDAEALGRFLVVVPGVNDQPDRWIQFGIWTPEDKTCYEESKKCKPIQNVSVIAVAKVGGDNLPAIPPLRHFDATADWFRCDGTRLPNSRACKPAGENKPVKLRYRYDVERSSDDCQRCHKLNPLSIHPQAAYEFNTSTGRLQALLDAEKAADAVNDRIRVRGSIYHRPPIFSTDPPGTTPSPRKDTAADSRNYGEWGFGADPGELRSDEWIAACSAPYKVSRDAFDRLRDSMSCYDCHDGRKPRNWGMLNYPIGTDRRRLIQYETRLPGFAPNIIRSHIVTGVMPLGQRTLKPTNLLQSDSEREALFECLSLEYFSPEGPSGVFVDWLRQEANPSTFAAITGSPPQKPTPEQHAFWSSRVPAAPSPVPVTTSGSDFTSHCGRCHKADGTESADGPGLLGIIGRGIAATAYPDYSDALRALGRKYPAWDEARLMDFLKDPDAYLSAELGGTQESEMSRRVRDEETRRRILSYLATLK